MRTKLRPPAEDDADPTSRGGRRAGGDVCALVEALLATLPPAFEARIRVRDEGVLWAVVRPGERGRVHVLAVCRPLVVASDGGIAVATGDGWAAIRLYGVTWIHVRRSATRRVPTLVRAVALVGHRHFAVEGEKRAADAARRALALAFPPSEPFVVAPVHRMLVSVLARAGGLPAVCLASSVGGMCMGERALRERGPYALVAAARSVARPMRSEVIEG